MAEMPGMIRPDLQALPQVRDRMTFLYLELAQACGQMLDGAFPAHAGVILSVWRSSAARSSFPRIRGGDPSCRAVSLKPSSFSPHTRGVIPF